MKILERIVYGLIRQMVSINDSQFGFVLGRGTTDEIFVVRQQAAAGEIPSSEQPALYGLCAPRESI